MYTSSLCRGPEYFRSCRAAIDAVPAVYRASAADILTYAHWRTRPLVWRTTLRIRVCRDTVDCRPQPLHESSSAMLGIKIQGCPGDSPGHNVNTAYVGGRASVIWFDNSRHMVALGPRAIPDRAAQRAAGHAPNVRRCSWSRMAATTETLFSGTRVARVPTRPRSRFARRVIISGERSADASYLL